MLLDDNDCGDDGEDYHEGVDYDNDDYDDHDVFDLLLTEIDKVLVCSVGGEPPDVQVGPERNCFYKYHDDDNDFDEDDEDDDINLDKESPWRLPKPCPGKLEGGDPLPCCI